MKKETTTNISTAVMGQIQSGKVHMKPRLYYALLSLLSVGVVVLAGLSIAYLSSVVFFWLRIMSADTMAYGARANLAEALASFPWWAPILALGLLVAAALLIHRQGRMYRHKMSTIILVITACALLLGGVLSFFGVGDLQTSHMSGQSGQGRGRWRDN